MYCWTVPYISLTKCARVRTCLTSALILFDFQVGSGWLASLLSASVCPALVSQETEDCRKTVGMASSETKNDLKKRVEKFFR
jgi:hypothetical protein